LNGGTILVSASSRTSVELLRLLCQDVWKVRASFADVRAEAQDLNALAALPHDAVLVIGDPALLLQVRNTYPYRYDLGEAWKRWTGLPFVFAVWAARREAAVKRVRVIHGALLRAKEWGLAHLETLAHQAALHTGIAEPRCLDYLSGLDYALSYRHLEGLTGFLRRLAGRGLVTDGALAFLSVA
jgi:chorismate dehydratase